jgi:flavin-dependent dehydrogenase
LLDPPGEFYFTPVADGQLQVAFLGEDLATRGFHKQSFAKKVMEHAALREIFVGAKVTSEVMGAGPFFRRAKSVVSDGLMLVGDAAGYVDAVTGEGMELALRSAETLGEVAAATLTRGGPTTQNLSLYAKKREAIVKDPERLTRLVLLLERFPTLARRAIPALKARPALFQKLLAVQGGEAPLSSLSVRDWLGLVGV